MMQQSNKLRTMINQWMEIHPSDSSSPSVYHFSALNNTSVRKWKTKFSFVRYSHTSLKNAPTPIIHFGFDGCDDAAEEDDDDKSFFSCLVKPAACCIALVELSQEVS